MNIKHIILASSLAVLTILGFLQSAGAHEEKGPHGGHMVDAGNMHIELLAKGTTLDVFIADASTKPIDATGYKGLAILVVGGKPARIALTPAGGDHLTGTTPVEVTGDPKGAVQITSPSGSTVQGKFE
jgi:hypothetical protein